MNENSKKLNRSVKIALLAAIASILMFIEFPIIPAFPWLKLDLSELPVLLGGFGLGTLAAVAIEFIKILLKLLLKGTETGFVGEIANFVIGCSLVLPAAIIYKKKRTNLSAILGMIIGIVIMNIFAIIANIYFLLPAYGIPVTPDYARSYALFGLIPLNSIKGLLTAVVSYPLYIKLGKHIFGANNGYNNVEYRM